MLVLFSSGRLFEMRILGIETSCDETSAAVIDNGNLLSNVVSSSMDLHQKYGGVVPEIAARAQIETILPVIKESLEISKSRWADIDGIAVTYGAGLGGSLLIGVMTARTLAIVKDKPLMGCNHVLGHIYVNFINKTSIKEYMVQEKNPKFPLIAVILSGGHSQLVLFRNHLDYTLLGRTQDDAIGEAFDKVAKILGLPYPGGPSISATALKGDPSSHMLPKAKVGKYDFSFSGLKTAVLRLAQAQAGVGFDFPSYNLPERLSEAQKANIAASFQSTAISSVVDKVLLAYEEYTPRCVLLAGGVAANTMLRESLADALPCPLFVPDPKLCTDNGAMIASLGEWQFKLNKPLANPYLLEIAPNLSM